jgi:hypothetical protein
MIKKKGSRTPCFQHSNSVIFMYARSSQIEFMVLVGWWLGQLIVQILQTILEGCAWIEQE